MDLILVWCLAEKHDLINILLLAVFFMGISNSFVNQYYPYFLKKQNHNIFTVVNITPVVVLMVFTSDASHDPKTANTTCHTDVLTEIPILP